jgi:phage gp45-like
VDDRRYRLRGLAAGEVALYDDQQQVVILSRDGVEIRTPHEIRLGEGATLGVARKDDAVEVTIPALSFLVAASAGVLNPSPIKVMGTVTSASARVKAVD